MFCHRLCDFPLPPTLQMLSLPVWLPFSPTFTGAVIAFLTSCALQIPRFFENTFVYLDYPSKLNLSETVSTCVMLHSRHVHTWYDTYITSYFSGEFTFPTNVHRLDGGSVGWSVRNAMLSLAIYALLLLPKYLANLCYHYLIITSPLG